MVRIRPGPPKHTYLRTFTMSACKLIAYEQAGRCVFFPSSLHAPSRPGTGSRRHYYYLGSCVVRFLRKDSSGATLT